MLKGKNALVTGAGSGIGLEILKKFAENRANIWAFVHNLDCHTEEEFQCIARQNHVWIKGIDFNLLVDDSVKQAVKQVLAENANIDVLVNCAGMVHAKTLGMTSLDEMRMAMSANFIMPSYIMQMISRRMIRQKSGNIINIISKSAMEYRSGAYAYGSSKMALLWGTKAAAKEFAPFQIRVNGIAPGLTETNLGTGRLSETEIEEYVCKNNIKRSAKPEEIANTALFLASDLSSYTSGQILNVDGGRY